MESNHQTFDIVIAGSGVAGLTAAIAAARHGLTTLVLEKTALWGGVSALSGGVLWTPAHHLVNREGVIDSEEQALRYLDGVIPDTASPASSARRRQTFVTNAARIVSELEADGLQFSYQKGFHDYHSDKPGASDVRGVGVAAFDGRKLGQWYKTLRKANTDPSIVVSANDVLGLLTPLNHPGLILRVLLKTLGWRLLGRKPLVFGQSLVAQLMRIALALGVEVKLSANVRDLLIENNQATGVHVEINGSNEVFRARAGIVLCSGGFARNATFRAHFQGLDGRYSAAVNPGDTGDLIQLGMAQGAATDLMDAYWGMPTVQLPDGESRMLLWERGLPHSILVDHCAERFANEAQSYDDLGHLLADKWRQNSEHKIWLIMDARHRRRYPFLHLPCGYTPRKWIESGFFLKAETLDALAEKCGLNPERLRATVHRFNHFAEKGLDQDFGRGNTAFDHLWGDQRIKPNPNLGPIEKPPFLAVRVYPGDLGTKGGLLTNEHSQVLRQDGSPIAGLYAAGNTSASVMGHSYPGPGGTLGPAAVFAQLAVEHAAGHIKK